MFIFGLTQSVWLPGYQKVPANWTWTTLSVNGAVYNFRWAKQLWVPKVSRHTMVRTLVGQTISGARLSECTCGNHGSANDQPWISDRSAKPWNSVVWIDRCKQESQTAEQLWTVNLREIWCLLRETVWTTLSRSNWCTLVSADRRVLGEALVKLWHQAELMQMLRQIGVKVRTGSLRQSNEVL